MKILQNIGEYFILMGRTFSQPTKASLIRKQISFELNSLGLGSMGIITIISAFMGAVITLQTASNIDSALIPDYTVGFTARQSMILEFSTTIIALILAGKVGSNIASEIGMMRVTEQIDALEVMGINSLNYLVFPKFISMLLYPFIISIAMFLGILGGMAACVYGGFSTLEDYIVGIQTDFETFHVVYAFIKTFSFAFLLATIPSFHGFYMKGGALEVGKASTTSFVWTSVAIIVLNYFLTQMLLS